MIEANPRASRTVPFVSKATGIPLAKMACRIMLGERMADLDLPAERAAVDHVSVKEAVLPFDRFAGADALLGPEMRSTGEVMGVAADFPTAFAKAQAAAGARAAHRGHRVHHGHRHRQGSGDAASPPSSTTSASGSSPRAAPRRRSRAWASRSSALNKLGEGSPHVVDWIERGDVDLVINTPTGIGRAHRRLGDPPRRRRARDPVHHDAVGRPARRRGRSPPRAHGEPAGALAPGAPRGRRGREVARAVTRGRRAERRWRRSRRPSAGAGSP